MTIKQIPAAQNDAWGFGGTMNEHASVAWPQVCSAILVATSQSLESVRIFLTGVVIHSETGDARGVR